MKKLNRSAYWDNMKGIMIIFVVFAHLILVLQSKSVILDQALEYIYMFHMPVFVFISGYFGKSENSRSFESIIKLVILYYIFNSISGLIYGFQSLLIPMYSYWYLIALIFWRITAPYFARFKYIYAILVFTGLLVGFFSNIDNTFAISRIICFYPYYMAGYKLSYSDSNELIKKDYKKRVLIGIAIMIPVCGIAYVANSFFSYSLDALQMFSYVSVYDILGRMVLYLIAFCIIYVLRLMVPDKEISLITSFGQYSIWIFILHRLLVIPLSDFYSGIDLIYPVPVTIITALALCMLLGNASVSRIMSGFLQDGVNVFTSEKKKKVNFTLIIMIAIYICFVLLVISSLLA